MNGLEYEIIICDIKLLNIKLEKLHIEGAKLLLEKPPIFFPNKRKRWHQKLDKFFNEELELHSKILEEYHKIENLLKK